MANYVTKKASIKILQPLTISNYIDQITSLRVDSKQILTLLKSITFSKYLLMLHHFVKRHSKARSIVWLERM